MDPISAPALGLNQKTAAAKTAPAQKDPLREAATSFEAVFLAEMFAHVGLGAPRKENGGGPGEQAFASFLSREWADKIAADGGIGLADEIYKSLAAKEAGDV